MIQVLEVVVQFVCSCGGSGLELRHLHHHLGALVAAEAAHTNCHDLHQVINMEHGPGLEAMICCSLISAGSSTCNMLLGW